MPVRPAVSPPLPDTGPPADGGLAHECGATECRANECRAEAASDLAQDPAAALRGAIAAGLYAPGARLPSEAALIARFGVSRHRVRAAIARLRAEGLVQSRQGAGVFVSAAWAEPLAPQQPGADLAPNWSPDLAPDLAADLPSDLAPDLAPEMQLLEIFEFRIAVESEAAALAAIRRSPAQEEEIFLRHSQFGAVIRAGLPRAQADRALHLAIAQGANNRQFSDFILASGAPLAPHGPGDLAPAVDSPGPDTADGRKDTGSKGTGSKDTGSDWAVHDEHGQIVQAIGRSDAAAARAAMRAHLEASLRRYRLAQQGRT